MEGVERSQPGKVEYRAEIHEKWVIALTRKDLDPARQLSDGGVRECLVRRRRTRSDVDGRCGDVLAENLGVPVAVTTGDSGHAVRLADVPVWIVQRGDGACVVEERVAGPDLRRKAKRIGHVLFTVSVVVNVKAVQHVIAKTGKVWPAGGLLKRDIVGDNRHGIRPIRAYERIDVRIVSLGIVADEWSLAVTRSPGRHHPQDRETCDEEKHDRLFHTAPPAAVRAASKCGQSDPVWTCGSVSRQLSSTRDFIEVRLVYAPERTLDFTRRQCRWPAGDASAIRPRIGGHLVSPVSPNVRDYNATRDGSLHDPRPAGRSRFGRPRHA